LAAFKLLGLGNLDTRVKSFFFFALLCLLSLSFFAQAKKPADGSPCNFASDCPAGFLCAQVTAVNSAGVLAYSCVDPLAHYEKKFEATYDKYLSGMGVIIKRTVYVIPVSMSSLKPGIVERSNYSYVSLTVQNAGDLDFENLELKEILPAYTYSGFDPRRIPFEPQPISSSQLPDGSMAYSWKFDLKNSETFSVNYTLPRELSQEILDVYKEPEIAQGQASPTGITGLIAGLVAMPPQVFMLFAVASFIGYTLLFSRSRSSHAEPDQRVMIQKVKDRLWHHPKSWRQSSNKLRES